VSLDQAVHCFDQAIALRRTLPLAKNPRYLYGLAAGWMNRGDALARLGSNDRLSESVKSYDEAIELLRSLSLAEDSLYPRRLSIAWINRGVALQKQETASAQTEAIRSFREALTVLKSPIASTIADNHLLQAGALTNLAGAILDIGQSAPEAQQLAQQALALIGETEKSNLVAAGAGFKARHVLCRAIAAGSSDGHLISPDAITAATDVVDEGLALARHWQRQGEGDFHAIAEDLFRFGCRIYQFGQPTFLVEFILENLDPERAEGVLPLNSDTHVAAVAALWNALKEVQRIGFQSLSTPCFDQMLDNLRQLSVTEERLKQLRQAALA
jgi:tetratricopeptide (TPR) repeat protein